MAAFTTLALIGLAAAAGGLAASKASGRQATGDQTDPSKGPHANSGPTTDAPPTPPPSLALLGGAAAQDASNAAARTRKRAGAGSTLLNGPTPNQAGTAGVGTPKTLLGY